MNRLNVWLFVWIQTIPGISVSFFWYSSEKTEMFSWNNKSFFVIQVSAHNKVTWIYTLLEILFDITAIS